MTRHAPKAAHSLAVRPVSSQAMTRQASQGAAAANGTRTPLKGPDDLRTALLRRPEQFVQTFTEGLLTYATGRKLEYYDMPTVRRIVRGAAANDYRFSSIVQAVVNIAAASDMKTTAEGVETEQQRNLLYILGCNEMQGFLFSPAVSAVEVRRLLLTHRGSAMSAA